MNHLKLDYNQGIINTVIKTMKTIIKKQFLKV